MIKKTLKHLYEEHLGKVSDKWSIYLSVYDRIFEPYRDGAIRLFEIGIQNGGSLDIWAKYLPNAKKLVGCDINPDCAKLTYEDPRIFVVVGDANADTTAAAVFSISHQFDIIIDDGSHSSSDIIKSFAKYWPHLADGGVYVAEDLHCSYWRNYEGGLYDPYSSMSFFKRLTDVINYEHWGLAVQRGKVLAGIFSHYGFDLEEDALEHIHSLEFINSICVIRKKIPANNTLGSRIFAGSAELVIPGLTAHCLKLTHTADECNNSWSDLLVPPDEEYLYLQNELIEKNNQLSERNNQLSALDKQLLERESQCSALGGQLSERNNQLAQRDAQVAKFDQAITELARENASANRAMTEFAQQIATLVAERGQFMNSTSWKITKPLRLIREAVINKSIRFMRKIVSDGVRQLWLKWPLSTQRKVVFKNKVFIYLPFAFRWSSAYRSWAVFNLPDVITRDSMAGLDVLPTPSPVLDAFVPLLQASHPTNIPVRLIAFYLPQFHPIAENNKWWGDGFTEWTNVRPARPQFAGHYQPHIPGELGYYNLLDPKIQHRQVELAKLYGVGGFCFYTYWFDGKLLLEKPIEKYLQDKNLDLPFCLCWANENWSRRWDGLDSEILIGQKHSADDDLRFIQHISQYLKDERYIRIDGKPLLLVYRPSLLPSARATAERWRGWCSENGLGEIYIAYTQGFEAIHPDEYGFDAAIEFPPNNSSPPNITDAIQAKDESFHGVVYDWRIFVERSRKYKKPDYKLFRSVCPSWDNTARRKNKGAIFLNSSPQGYQEWLFNAINETCARATKPAERLIFVNAWNEWAEGAHLEPDQRHGYAYLEATRMALIRSELCTSKVDNLLPSDISVAIIIHAFYLDIFDEILVYINKIKRITFKLYVTTPFIMTDEVKHRLSISGHNFFILPVDNCGRDVLPMLKIMPEILVGGHDFVIKVHTKKSLHRLDGDTWRKDLFEGLVGETAIAEALALFNKNPSLGIWAPRDHIVPLTYYWGSNGQRVTHLASRLGVGGELLKNLYFVAGTMFIARIQALRPLLNLAISDEDFESETGQVDGTMAHAIERLIGVSAYAANYYLPSGINERYRFAA